jgi:hypothetical protein
VEAEIQRLYLVACPVAGNIHLGTGLWGANSETGLGPVIILSSTFVLGGATSDRNLFLNAIGNQAVLLGFQVGAVSPGSAKILAG